jgi:hypothetical protein
MWQPWVFAEGNYRVRISIPESAESHKLKGFVVKARANKNEDTIEASF